MQQRHPKFTRGDDYSFSVTWEHRDDPLEELQPVPIASARVVVRRQVDSESTILSLSDEDDQLTIEGNRVRVSLSSDFSKTLSSGIIEVEATATSGQVRTIFRDQFEVEPDVAR